MLRHEVHRRVAVDERAEGDADDDPGRDPAHELARRAPGVAHPLLHRQAHLDGGPGVDLVDVGLDEALEVQPADDQAGADGDGQPGDQVGDRDGRAEQAPQQHERDLVDHRRRR